MHARELSLILMRSSRHGPFRDFFERFTLCIGRGRKGESVGPKPRKEYQFWIRSGRPFHLERERERRLRENRREDSLSLFFPFLLFPLDRSQTGSSLFSLATRGLEADTARGGHRPTIRYDCRRERSYLDSRGKNEAKKRELLLIGDPTRRQIWRTVSFLLSSFYFSGRYVQGFDSLVNLIIARLDLPLPVAWVDRIADVVA